MITLEVKSPIEVRRGLWLFSGTLAGDGWGLDVRIEVAKTGEVKPLRVFAEAFRPGDVTVAGFWDTFNQVVNHPGMNAALAAVSLIPGAGQVAAPALMAARAVGAIGSDVSAAQLQKAQKARLEATAKKIAAETNAVLRKANRPVVVTSGDVRRALVARALAPNVSKAGLAKALTRPFVVGSPEHRGLVALQVAQMERGESPLKFESYAAQPAIAAEDEPAPDFGGVYFG